MRLWSAPVEIDPLAIAFASGRDRECDSRLLPYDCLATIAHAQGLWEIGQLTKEEFAAIRTGLETLRAQVLAGQAQIPESVEDGHEFIENRLVEEVGECAKKVHSYRSRNDQVWTAMLLYVHEALGKVLEGIESFELSLKALDQKSGRIPLPGYSHSRKAMPTTVGDWLGMYRSALMDSAKLILFVSETVHRSPLGSGAGYGFRGGPDREATARRLGFNGVVEEVVYVQASRSKYSSWILFALTTLLQDLSRLATDLIVFSMPEFAYFKLPQSMLLGSSVMPHKRNPDVLEIVRAQVSVALGDLQQVLSLGLNLVFGYHRDLQLTKAPVMNALQQCQAVLTVLTRFMGGVEVNESACRGAMGKELYSVERALELTRSGLPFREAHREVAREGWERDRDENDGQERR